MADMTEPYHRRNKIPMCVRPFLQYGYLVGGAATWLMAKDGTDAAPRDYDVVIPPEKWREAVRLVPVRTPANSFGGFKLRVDGVSIDIWCDTVDHFLLMSHTPGIAIKPFDDNGYVLGIARPFGRKQHGTDS